MKTNAIKTLTVATLLLIIFATLMVGLSSVYAEEAATSAEQGEGQTTEQTPSTDAADEGDKPIVDLHFDKNNVIAALNIMWKGVLAIFVTIAIIIVLSIGINKLCNKADAAIKQRQQKIEEDLRKDDKQNQD